MNHRPYVLTIAGFDPTGGAGILADIKTMENLHCYGLAVCTANTIQSDTEMTHCHWIPIDIIKTQLYVLLKRFDIPVIKIGIVENWNVLEAIIDYIISMNSQARIILDPILKSSSGFEFLQPTNCNDLETKEDYHTNFWDKIYLITPNYIEINTLFNNKSMDEVLNFLKEKTNVFVKGGHRTDSLGKDVLYHKKKMYSLEAENKNCYEKHGSGCILSAAIASNLALGLGLYESCLKGKRYIENVLSSNQTLLGYHVN